MSARCLASPPLLIITIAALAVSAPAQPQVQEADASRSERPVPAAMVPLALFTWADFDGDGFVDAFAIQPDGEGLLLHNLGDGQFEEQSERRGLHDAVALSDAAWTDYDSDGHLDLLWVSPTGPLRLWRQTDGGSFVDETSLAGLAEVGGGLEVEWRDLNVTVGPICASAAARGQRALPELGGGYLHRGRLLARHPGARSRRGPGSSTMREQANERSPIAPMRPSAEGEHQRRPAIARPAATSS